MFSHASFPIRIDFNIAGGTDSVTQVLANWQNIVGNASVIPTGFIVLEHDLFLQSVEVATGYILPAALANNPPLKIVPVITCLHKSFNEAYLETNDNSSNPIPNPTGGNSSGSSGSGAQGTGGGSGSGASQNGAVSSHSVTSGFFALAGSAALALVAAFA